MRASARVSLHDMPRTRACMLCAACTRADDQACFVWRRASRADGSFSLSMELLALCACDGSSSQARVLRTSTLLGSYSIKHNPDGTAQCMLAVHGATAAQGGGRSSLCGGGAAAASACPSLHACSALGLASTHARVSSKVDLVLEGTLHGGACASGEGEGRGGLQLHSLDGVFALCVEDGEMAWLVPDKVQDQLACLRCRAVFVPPCPWAVLCYAVPCCVISTATRALIPCGAPRARCDARAGGCGATSAAASRRRPSRSQTRSKACMQPPSTIASPRQHARGQWSSAAIATVCQSLRMSCVSYEQQLACSGARVGS